MKLITKGVVEVDTNEDGDQAIVCYKLAFQTKNSGDNEGMAVILKSWDETTTHIDLKKFIGKKVKITIETI